MKEITSAIDIAASPERIWRVLTDFDSYPRWNPFIRGVKAGKLQPGARLYVRARIRPRGRAHIISATVSKAIPAADLRWRGNLFLAGLFHGEHAFIIVPQGLDGARLIQRERFSGLLSSMIFPLIEANTRRSIEEMNRALKHVAEH